MKKNTNNQKPLYTKINSAMDLEKDQTAHYIVDLLHRVVVHYGLWFSEVRHQLGPEKSLEVLGNVFERSLGIQLKRFSKVLDFEVKDGLPAALFDMDRKKMDEFINAIAANWLANDGVWFQGVEFEHGMFDAKRANDTCWTRFSPFEAWSVRRLLNLPKNPGLEGLKKALNFRLYAFVNTQSIISETPTSFVFQMNQCRVQVARKKKGLDDYPCKSGGMCEYPTFAATIDPRIKTECVGCPPDPHPDSWYCAWKFSI